MTAFVDMTFFEESPPEVLHSEFVIWVGGADEGGVVDVGCVGELKKTLGDAIAESRGVGREGLGDFLDLEAVFVCSCAQQGLCGGRGGSMANKGAGVGGDGLASTRGGRVAGSHVAVIAGENVGNDIRVEMSNMWVCIDVEDWRCDIVWLEIDSLDCT